MARLRYNALKTGAAGSGVALSLGASLTNSATSVTFNAALTYNNGTSVPTISGSDYIPLEILDASGNMTEIVWLTAYTSGATTGTISRGQEGTSGVAHSSGDKVIHGPTVDDVSTGGVLAALSYEPSSLATYGPFTTNAATDIDATNLVITFITPQSGKVEVCLEALYQYKQTSASQSSWCLREGSTLIAETYVAGNSAAVTVDTGNIRTRASIQVSGLTPGSTHTYKWAWRAYPASTLTMYAGASSTTVGGATMKVSALP